MCKLVLKIFFVEFNPDGNLSNLNFYYNTSLNKHFETRKNSFFCPS